MLQVGTRARRVISFYRYYYYVDWYGNTFVLMNTVYLYPWYRISLKYRSCLCFLFKNQRTEPTKDKQQSNDWQEPTPLVFL